MTVSRKILAIDLGAESGRAVLTRFDGSRLDLTEIHRFPNRPVRLPDGLHWDILNIWGEIKISLGKTLEKGIVPDSLGMDTWGVDFALLDRKGSLVSNPYHYRDSRTDGMIEEAYKIVPQADIFNQTGIQILQFNSLFQLLSMIRAASPTLKITDTFLTLPDLMNYWLTGEKVCELTNATTTQCFDTRRGVWAAPLLERLGIPTPIFPGIVPPGTRLGSLLPDLASELGLPRIPVIAPACHDTGSAVAAIPALEPDFAWISSGTWSIMGVETPAPVVNEKSLAYNFTNEGGVAGTTRLSRNIMGMWLVQECRRVWEQHGDTYTYDDLTRLAESAEPLRFIIDPDENDFLKPGDMPARIRAYCLRSGQGEPDMRPALVRCILESIALKYRWVLEKLEDLTGKPIQSIYIVGGGTRNSLLCQFTADATGRQVFAGPVEATATGNSLVQLMTLGEIDSLSDGRQLICDSFEVKRYEPNPTGQWDQAYEKMVNLMMRGSLTVSQ